MENKRQTEVVLIGNEKGGVAKTTTTICLANCLTALGYKVLVVDLDPSGNLSDAVLPDFPAVVLYDVMSGKCHVRDAIIHTEIGDILPTVKDLSPETTSPFMAPGMEDRKSLGDLFASWVGRRGAEKCIYNLLNTPGYAPIFNQYDFILMDSQPSDSLIITNAIVAAHSILFPCEPVSGALDGLTKFRRSIQLTHESYGANAFIDGLVFVKYDEDWRTRQKMVSQIQQAAEADGTFVYGTRFRTSASIETAMNECKPILDPKYLYMGWGAHDAMNFTLEFLARRGMAPKVRYPGVFHDEFGKLIYRRKGDPYWALTEQQDSSIRIEVMKYRDAEVQADIDKVGKTLFFHPASIEQLLQSARVQGRTVICDGQSQKFLAGMFQKSTTDTLGIPIPVSD